MAATAQLVTRTKPGPHASSSRLHFATVRSPARHASALHEHTSLRAQQVFAEHVSPSDGPSVSRHRQPSLLAPHDGALHEHRRPSAGQPSGAQQIACGSVASPHAASLGVVESVHEHVCPWPKLDATHFVLLRADGALHSLLHRSSRQRPSAAVAVSVDVRSAATASHFVTSPAVHVSRAENVASHAPALQHPSTSASQRVRMHWPHGVSSPSKRQCSPKRFGETRSTHPTSDVASAHASAMLRRGVAGVIDTDDRAVGRAPQGRTRAVTCGTRPSGQLLRFWKCPAAPPLDPSRPPRSSRSA